MDRQLAKQIRTEIENTLTKNGIPGCKITIKGGTIWPNAIVFKLEVAEIQNGVALSTEATEFLDHVKVGGTDFKPEDLGKKVRVGSEEYEVIGAKWYTKFPIIMKRTRDSKIFKFPARTALVALGRNTSTGLPGGVQ